MNTMFPIHLLCSSYKSTGRGSGERGGGFQQALRSSRGCGAVKTDRPRPRTAGRREEGREGGRSPCHRQAGRRMMGNLHVEPMRRTWRRRQAGVVCGGVRKIKRLIDLFANDGR